MEICLLIGVRSIPNVKELSVHKNLGLVLYKDYSP
jgi:hypothetical protein